MISGILLAAGESKRMQPEFKPLLKWGKRTVIGECVHQLRNSQLADIYVVLGHREADIRARLAGTGVQFTVNENYQKGMLTSVKTGLAMLGPNTDAVLIALVDQPMITSALINQLIEAYGDGSKGIVIPTFNGKHGHPIIIGAGYVDEIMQLDDTAEGGLRNFINDHKSDWLEVPVATPDVLEDIDLPEHYERLSKLAQPIYEHHKWHP
ncbi:MAG TPA: nucleotidyltransferase family protein [Blastocatellia bacterium]|nr:nucleotidyltransferase family protein [Blastocatellia bacterium]HMV82975.1 nucleotidyltransferase family protein [Blastocatellia bacterium]HMX27107.1 nucleotidyltransferase family protein [Blastocatellia bacterium]HMY71491.1 nucleotidyltransferase family protein [Blastocatellia bacterium]HMZ17630.1 nucleotidyltransferase family protein [Blastocatellia bacterium]